MFTYPIKQSSTAYPLVFLMVSSTDHISPITGISPTVTLSKNGGSFASPSGAVTEIGNGLYKVAGNATDTNTLGPLVLHATGTGADPADYLYTIIAGDPQATSFGLSLAKTTNITGFNDIAATAVVSSGAITTSGGAVSTVTNLTNAPTNGDLTATMKTSVTTAATAATPTAAAVTGNVGGSVGSISGVTFPTNFSALSIDSSGFVKLVGTPKKNTAISGFQFYMTLSSDHASPATGKTITATRSIDGGAFSSCTNTASELGNGFYKIDLSASDLNGTTIALLFTATSCDATVINILTTP